jgi:hypothetical protein
MGLKSRAIRIQIITIKEIKIRTSTITARIKNNLYM